MVECENHPERAAVGLCMRCRAPVCAACCTRVDEVNHCPACLKELASRPPPAPPSSAPAAALLVAAACLFFYSVFWVARSGLIP
jgi:hypothetical protein